ncbi:2-oxo acid dehydrogenase subunit E2 [Nautilia lithotrophica]
MEYKVTMPILSDTMDKGKITKWYVKVGDYVKKGDKLCEVESDKAVMDIESFEEGVVKEILAKVGEEVPVKSVIAIIENGELRIENEKSEKLKVENEEKKEPENEKPKPKQPEEKNEINLDDIINSIISEPKKEIKGTASPVAKKEAANLGIDIEKLQQNGTLPKPAHLKDIKELKLKRYFTPKALKMLNDYQISPDEFKLNHKITQEEVLNYIKQNNIPKKTPLTPNQTAVIKNLQNSLTKPTFFIFEEIETTKKYGIKITAQIIKALANAMQKHPLTRTILQNDTLLTFPASNISVAVSRNDGLYMCVIKNVEDKDLNEINEWLKKIKTKKLTLEDISGSTFGISNLGMFGIESFTALINDKDAGIAAFGKLNEGKIKVNFTFDHRILNGVDAALFVNSFKEEMKNV